MSTGQEEAGVTWAHVPGYGINHLPYGAFSVGDGPSRLGVRIGDRVLDLEAALGATSCADMVRGGNLDRVLAAGADAWTQLRAAIIDVLGRMSGDDLGSSLVPLSAVGMHLPFTIGDYVDFYGNQNHAENMGRIFRPGQPPLTPNWKHIPIGYHGRSGTIRVSGSPVSRPLGMIGQVDGPPIFGPSTRLDIEAELGFVVGGRAPEGMVSIDDAEKHIFGVLLTNDWSARDIQAYEYVPLGPHLGKSFATTVGAWVTPLSALNPWRVPPPRRDVEVAAYLDDRRARPWGFNIQMEVVLNGQVVSRPPVAATYWTAAQMLAHMTVNGASIRPGDFFAGGTVSGARRGERGSLLELTWGGIDPLRMADGSSVTFLRDGDEVVLRARTVGDEGAQLSLGDCAGMIFASPEAGLDRSGSANA